MPGRGEFVVDENTKEFEHPVDEIAKIKDIMYEHVKGARVKDGQVFQTLEDFQQHVRDGFWNPMSGIGSRDDPGVYNYAYIPVSMSPQEATAYYASGGIPAVITDKKAKGVLLNGYTFEGDGWTPDEFKRMHDYCEQIEGGVAISNSLRDGLIYGGAIAYPRFKQDTVRSLEMTVKELLDEGVITKDCIDHFVTTDRWNCVLVPNWNVTARDYLTPSHYYIPIGGVKVATQRSAIVRPKMLPYWGMLPQIGWGVSDFEGYISSVLAYQITIASIPIMAQQMSLLFHEIPIDGVMAQNGEEAIDWLLAHNDQVMRSWSLTHPVSISSFGKVGAVERHYENFDQLVMMLRQDVGARSEMPESVIFPSQPTGLADSRGEDVLLKQAESIQKIAITVRPQFRNLCRMIALSCFGPEYFSGAQGRQKLSTLALSFNPPSVQSAKEKAESGGKFADFVSKLSAPDLLPVDMVLELSKQFFPDVEISKELMQRITAIPESQTPPDYAKVLAAGGLIEKLVGGQPPGLEKVLAQGDLPKQLASIMVADGSNGNGHSHPQRLMNYRLAAIEKAVKAVSEMPEPGPVRVVIDQKPVRKTYKGKRDAFGNIDLDSIVVTEEVIEEK